MDSRYSDQQRGLADAVRSSLDALGLTRRDEISGGAQVSGRVSRAFADLGVFGLSVPEAAGGAGLGPIDLVAVNEQVGRSLTGAESALGAAAAGAVLACPDQADPGQADCDPSGALEAILDGSATVGVALREADGGWWSTPHAQADQRAEGWRVTGTKTWAVGAGVADLLVVSARTASGEPGAFLVDAGDVRASPRTNASGVHTEAAIELVDAPVRAAWIGPLDTTSLDPVTSVLVYGGLASAAQAVGGAARTLEDVVRHATNRVQFGAPIGSFQAVAHQCADIALDLERMRSLTHHAAWSLTARRPDALRETVSLTALVAEAAPRLLRTALHIYGGIGFTWEHDLHLYLTHAHYLAQVFGDAGECHRMAAALAANLSRRREGVR